MEILWNGETIEGFTEVVSSGSNKISFAEFMRRKQEGRYDYVRQLDDYTYECTLYDSLRKETITVF